MTSRGIFQTPTLHQRGLSKRDITRLVQTGTLTHLCRGWYADDTADPDLCRAIRLGGRVGCLSGCTKHGLWVPPHTGLHVVHGAGFAPEPSPGIVLHPSGRRQPAEPIWPLLDCLEHVLTRHDAESALIVAESAIDRGLADEADVRALLRNAPYRSARLIDQLAWAQSGSETRVRLFLLRRRVGVRGQVKIPGLGRVDLLVGKSLILECDSGAHHSTREQQEEDRRRDLLARDLGFDVIRLSYRQIWHEWPDTRQVLLRHLRRDRHRRPAA